MIAKSFLLYPENSNIYVEFLLLGRIYASKKFPEILYGEKAPQNIKGQDTQTQYTFMASAVRSTNMDRYIKDFMSRNPSGVVVLIGEGLETTFYCNDNEKTVSFEIDLPDVIAYRIQILGENERDICIECDAF